MDFTGAGQSLYTQLYCTYANNIIIITYQTLYNTTTSSSFKLSSKIINNFQILQNLFHLLLSALVMLAEITQLGKLLHVFTTLSVNQYFRTSYLKQVFWSLRLILVVTYVQAWTRVSTAALSYFSVNILYVSIMWSCFGRLFQRLMNLTISK